MQLTKTFLFATLATVVSCQVSSDQLVSDIGTITDLSSQTDDAARNITLANVFTTGPQLINNFQSIVSIIAEDADALSGSTTMSTTKHKRSSLPFVGNGPARALEARQATPPYSETNQLAICDAFRTFVMVHQALLATVIGQHGLLASTPFTQPIAQVLRVLEGGVDTIAFDIIDLVPTCASDATDNKNAVDESLEEAVNTYSS